MRHRATEAELLAAARAGEGEALEALLSHHEERVYRFGLRMCGSEADAKDVLQETLLAAFQGVQAFRGDAELSTWLYQVARSHCTRLRRRRAGEPGSPQRLDSAEAAAVPAEAATPDEAAHARQLGEALQAAILALPETAREAIVLRDVEGLPAEDAARVVGIEVRALKSRLHRARLLLRENLATLLTARPPARARRAAPSSPTSSVRSPRPTSIRRPASASSNTSRPAAAAPRRARR
jgi:RNA polymerase sigma-70 factor (ECF subfamily)